MKVRKGRDEERKRYNIEISEGEAQWETNQGQAYRLVSDVFKVTGNAADIYCTLEELPPLFVSTALAAFRGIIRSGRFQPRLQEAEANGKDRTARMGEAYPETAGTGKGERPGL